VRSGASTAMRTAIRRPSRSDSRSTDLSCRAGCVRRPDWILAMTRALVVVLSLVGCGKQAAEETSWSVDLDWHGHADVTRKPADPRDVVDVKPELRVVGPRPEIVEAMQQRMSERHDPGRIAVEITIDPSDPPASGTLHAKVHASAVWFHLP